MADLTVSFEIYNEETVRILQEEDPDLLPTYKVNSSKDLAYNKKQVTSAITSGIIKGDSIPTISQNLQSTMKNLNQSSAVSAARTAATTAQNTGKLSTMKELAAMGVDIQKEWVATLDSRTRPSHAALDGQRRDLDEAFSNGLQYPGASGNAAERWNCRCTMKSYMPKYDSDDEPRLTYSEWEAYKKATGSTAKKITKSDYSAAKAMSQASSKIAGTHQDGLYSYTYEYDPTTKELTVTKDVFGKTETHVYHATDKGINSIMYESYMKEFDIEEQLKAKTSSSATIETNAKGTKGAIKLNDGAEANEWFYEQPEYKAWKAGLSNGDMQAIRKYTGSAYEDLNNVLRKYNLSKYTQDQIYDQYEYADRLDKGLSGYCLTEDVTVRRGLSKGQVTTMIKAAGTSANVNDLNSLVGTTLLDEGYASATVVMGKASSMTEDKDVMLYVDVPAGYGRGAYINELSYYMNDEYEWLFARNAEFTVTSVSTETGDIEIYAKLKT